MKTFKDYLEEGSQVEEASILDMKDPTKELRKYIDKKYKTAGGAMNGFSVLVDEDKLAIARVVLDPMHARDFGLKEENVDEAVSSTKIKKDTSSILSDLEKYFFALAGYVEGAGVPDKDFSQFQQAFTAFEKSLKNIQKKL